MKVPKLQILTAAQSATTGGRKHLLDLRKASKKAGFDDLIGMGREAVYRLVPATVTAAIRNCSRCRCLSLSLQRLATVCIKHSRPMLPPSRNRLVDYINREYIGQTGVFLKRDAGSPCLLADGGVNVGAIVYYDTD